MRLTGATRFAMEMASGLMILGLATAGFVIAQGIGAGPTATSDEGPASIGTTSAGEGAAVDHPVSEIAEADASRGLDTPAPAQAALPTPAASDAPDGRSPSTEEEPLGASVIPPWGFRALPRSTRQGVLNSAASISKDTIFSVTRKLF
jgi:hypothetical protein